jgi:4-alpha-glucanotransferase
VGVDPSGADAWANQNAVLSGLCIGAPPDEFNPAGQNWGLAPFNPHRLADNDFSMFRRVLRAAMRCAGAVRLDHVIGLKRLYLISPASASDGGTYVHYPFEALMQVIADESRRNRCIFVGEDLGTVPEGFQQAADRYGMWSYRVMLFERRHGGAFKPPEDYPRNAIATFATHDMPTFAGWTSSYDLAVKRGVGVNPGESEDAREHSRQMLRQALAHTVPDFDTSQFPSIAAYLAATPSRMVMVAIEDLLDVADQVNVPGTIDQYPNWRRKLPRPVEEWRAYPTFERTVRVFETVGRRCSGD